MGRAIWADPESQTDPLGRVTSWDHDNLGRRTKTTLPDPDRAGPLAVPMPDPENLDNFGW